MIKLWLTPPPKLPHNYPDTFIGLVPIGGRVADTFYKANIWNYESLEDWIVEEGIFEVSDQTRRDAQRRAQEEEKAYGLNFRTAWKLGKAFLPYGSNKRRWIRKTDHFY